MATFIVTNLNDSGAGSLRQAVLDANANAGADTITFDASLTGGTSAGVDDGLVRLTSGQLIITDTVVIDGDVDGDNKADILLDGDGTSRVAFVFGSGVTADLQSLTLQNGYSSTTGGALAADAGTQLNLTHVTVRNSSAYGGGAVSADASVFTNSTFSGNSATLGGALYFRGANASLTNVTVSGNTASAAAGGIFSYGADFTLNSTTITENILLAGAVYDGAGIGLFGGADATVLNSIVSANTGGTADVVGSGPAEVLAAEHSLFGTTTVIDIDSGGNIATDTPLLEALADNGGTVETHALSYASLALSAGDATLLPSDGADLDGDADTAEDLPLDANGNARINDVLDLGAVEADQSLIIVDTLADEDDGDFGAGDLSLREAIGLVTPDGLIVFDAAITGGVAAGIDDGAIVLSMGELAVSKNLTVNGDVDDDLRADITLDGNDASRVFNLSGTTTDVALRSLDITGGFSSSYGGAIYSLANHLSIVNSTVRESTGSVGGGIIATDLTLANTSILNNSATSTGGGVSIFSGNTGIFDNVTVSGNGGAAQASGVLVSSGATLVLRNSTVTDNSGGSFGGITATSNSSVTSHNSIVSGNSGSSRDDFFLSSSATLTAQNSLLGTGVTPSVDNGGNISSDVPGLEALADNGGPVRTHALQLTSAAFSAGDAALLVPDASDVDGDGDTTELLPLDANGNARVLGAALDIGATEAQVLTDIAIDNFTASPTSATVGQTLTISWDVENVGIGSVGTVRTGVYLSTDADVTVADTLVGHLDTDQITLPGDLQMQTVDLAITGPIPAGTYFLAAITDDTAQQDEADEANNVSAAVQIVLTGFGPVTLNAGGTLSGYATLGQAFAAAGDNDAISVDTTNYLADPETAVVSSDNLSISLSAGIAPVLDLLEAASVLTVSLSGAGTAQVRGNSFANAITSGDGNDTLSGLSGADTLDGGLGLNTADYSMSDARVEVDLAFGTAAGGHAAGDVLINMQDLVGSDFNDLLRGGNGANRLEGGGGVDNINGRGGDDLLLGGLGADLVSGGNNNDTLLGGTDGDQLFGNAGSDMVFGEAGVDTIFGGTGNDSIRGGDDNDELSGQGGSDTIFGDGGENILRGGSGDDVLIGGGQNDQLYGNGNNDNLQGGGGNDILQGADGADLLFGQAGDDTLTGSNGADRLDGGTGNDVMNGGGADGVRDVFVYLIGYEQDRVNAFDQLGTDQLQLDTDLWTTTHPGLTEQQVIDTFGTLNPAGTILTLDFGGGDILEVQNALGIDQGTLGADVVFV